LELSARLTRRVRDVDRGRIWRLHIDEGIEDQQGPVEQLKTDSTRRILKIQPILIPQLERLRQCGRSFCALPRVVAANMGHSSFTMTAKHYAQPQAIAEAHSARVAQMLDLEPGAPAFSQRPAEQLIDALPAATLTRIAEILTQRITRPTRATDGRGFPTEIPT
jgi:hypothetical protein